MPISIQLSVTEEKFLSVNASTLVLALFNCQDAGRLRTSRLLRRNTYPVRRG